MDGMDRVEYGQDRMWRDSSIEESATFLRFAGDRARISQLVRRADDPMQYTKAATKNLIRQISSQRRRGEVEKRDRSRG